GRSDRWHQGLLLVAAARVRWVRPVRFGATRAVLRRLKRLRRLMMESSATVARLAPAVIDPRRWWALALLFGGFFMVVLGGTIPVVALPSIGAGLCFAKQDLPWVLSAYALTFGGLLLLGGRAADLLGRRLVFMAGVLFFTAASLMCALAWSPAAL